MEGCLLNVAGWLADSNGLWHFPAAGVVGASVLWQSATFKGQRLMHNSTQTQRLSLCGSPSFCLRWARLKAFVTSQAQAWTLILYTHKETRPYCSTFKLKLSLVCFYVEMSLCESKEVKAAIQSSFASNIMINYKICLSAAYLCWSHSLWL